MILCFYIAGDGPEKESIMKEIEKIWITAKGEDAREYFRAA